MLLDLTIGRKGLLNYLKALAGSNIVKIVPAADGAGETQTVGKRLLVRCGSNTGFIEDTAWIGDNTPHTLCEVRISPNRKVTPNIGGLELAEALNRVLPFTAKEDNRPVFQCVLFKAAEGKLDIISADGFRLAVVTLDYDGEGEALILRDDLKGIANALSKAHRVNLSFEKSQDDPVSGTGVNLVIDTEITRYRWLGADGTFPEYQKLIPSKANTTAHLDTVEAAKAIASLKALAGSADYPIDLCFNGGIILSSPDDRGEALLAADIEGDKVNVRIDGGYLTEALRACGGMVDMKLADGKSPVLFTTAGYQLVVMPMITADNPAETSESQTAEDEALETEPSEAVAEAEKITETAKVKKPKKKKAKTKEPAGVA